MLLKISISIPVMGLNIIIPLSDWFVLLHVVVDSFYLFYESELKVQQTKQKKKKKTTNTIDPVQHSVNVAKNVRI